MKKATFGWPFLFEQRICNGAGGVFLRVFVAAVPESTASRRELVHAR
jgi:hypothetical protein